MKLYGNCMEKFPKSCVVFFSQGLNDKGFFPSILSIWLPCSFDFFLGGWGRTLQRVMLSFYTLLLCVTSRGRLVFCKDFYLDVFQKIQKMEGQWRGQTDAGTVEFSVRENSRMISPASVAQRPLRIASQLTFSSQLAYSNHTHHKGLPLHGTPFQARYQTSGSV